MARVLGLCCFLALGGCEGIVGDRDLGADPSASVTFDLTNDSDRGQFQPTDLEYTGSVGSYAMFLVTGSNPRLDGPEVHFAGGYAVLRGADTYFTPGMHAPTVQVSLAGGTSADSQLLAYDLSATRFAAGCATAVDHPSQRLSSNVPVQRIGVSVSPAPPVGSLVLLRAVVLSGAEPTMDSAGSVATVCCQSTDCSLQ
jgi:hypothetical protein